MIGFAHLADTAAVRNPRARLLVPAAPAVLTTALLPTAFATVGPGVDQFLLIVVWRRNNDGRRAGVGRGGRRRASGAARDGQLEMTVVQNLVGLAVGVVLVGWVSDRYGLTTVLAVLRVVSAVMFWYGSRFYERDRAAVPAAAGPLAPARPQAGHS